ncbi:unnamed protein product [Kuraishia capsulata CBS 1993]|uniref:ABC transporter domain-containing protein n=1 Tax=Kuraishia capsulata CBS 1993 TaxID=1382522 RepID=W6MIB1_9ASCO|nr:uncharacterized protein KUCA_T00001852001 [Kuraishia capsulata CBS 1993]CDK25881.1 unnamed protein product [Kuraishia capsulata CBS 1993]
MTLLSFYAKRRNKILRASYVVLLLLSLLGGGAQKSQRKLEGKRSRALTKFSWNSISKSSLLSVIDLVKVNGTRKITGFLALQLVLLVTRAFLTLKVASLDGRIVSTLISRRFKQFAFLICVWMGIGIPASLTNSLLTWSERMLGKNIRLNLTEKLLDDYLPESGNSTLYQLLNTSKNSDPDEAIIEDPNQRITTNVEQFSKALASLPSQLLKPSLDLLLCANQLASTSGSSAEGVLLLGIITHTSTILLKQFTPNFTKYSQMTNELEHGFHSSHSNTITNCEEIAFSRGHRRELDHLDTRYLELEKFKRLEYRRFAIYDFTMSFIVKYFWGASGLLLCSIPIFTRAHMSNYQISEHDMRDISANFITNRRLLLSASSSLGRLIQSKKNVQNLVGYSVKLVEFENALSAINSRTDSSAVQSVGPGVVAIGGTAKPLISGSNILYGDEVTFDHIPLITPTGNTLVADLCFSIKSGDNLLITGPNGCGKSSLFRILGGLWKVADPGKLTIPYSKDDLFYLPQRAYLTIGTLKEQIIYPDSIETFNRKSSRYQRANGTDLVKDEAYLVELLKIVQLGHLVDDCENIINDSLEKPRDLEDSVPESPLDLIRKWPTLLSIGEQQRLALARLYYHQPKFAVLDECTSSISPELEQECYRYAIEELGITVITVCHRTSLWKFHQYLLNFDGQGNAKFTRFDPELRLKWHDELIDIDSRLHKMEGLKKQLGDLERLKEGHTTKPKKLMYL